MSNNVISNSERVMSDGLKIVFLITMTSALMFGFGHLFFAPYHFERLHIFLFNLCSGGTLILYFTEGKSKMSIQTIVFYFTTIFYALFAYFELYILAIITAIILAIIVERVRIRKFSFFPFGFFQRSVHVSEKFHLASLLCLSMGLIISCLAIINQEYFRWLDSKKLQLDTFFLGFSFPLSLITLSMMFSMMSKGKTNLLRVLKLVCFWTINLGVIIFFTFILMESQVLELVISSILFVAVATTLFLYVYLGGKIQQKSFLASGMLFLVMTAVSGIIYILLYFLPNPNPIDSKIVLHYHRVLSLYGWNLCGLAIICRYNDFPIQLHTGRIIALHWLTVGILAPIGYYNRVFSILAVVSYAIFLSFLFFSKPVVNTEVSNG